MEIFDRRLVGIHQQRARRLRQEADLFLWRHGARQLQNRLLDIRQNFAAVLECGPVQAVLTPEFLQNGKVARPHFLLPEIDIDAEFWPFAPASLDGIVSHGHLHWVNDLPGALVQFRQSLKPDGLFLGLFFGGESLRELRAAVQQAEFELYGGISPRVSPFVALQDMAALMQRAQFALPVVDNELVTITYRSLPALVADLRAMGQTSAIAKRDRHIVARDFWPRVEAAYRALFPRADGKLPVTVELIYALGWSPAASQPQPLKRGSATHRLEDILKQH